MRSKTSRPIDRREERRRTPARGFATPLTRVVTPTDRIGGDAF
jgi:hypothetical protein